MEMTDFLTFSVATIVAMLGFYMKQIATEVKEIRREHNECKNDLPRQFVLKEDYHNEVKQLRDDIKEDIKDIKGLIGKLFEKVEGRSR